MKKKIGAMLLSMVLVVSMMSGCGEKSSNQTASNTSDEKEKIVVCLDWTPNTNHTGLYVAKNLGYYEDAGFDVEIVQPPEDGAVLMCASGQAQYAIGYQDTIAASYDLDEPLGVTSVAALVQHNTSGIISRKGDGIDHPAGLQGKAYSTWESPIELAMLENIVTKDGGDFSKVKLIPNNITDEPGALTAKQTDAIWVYEGWGLINAQLSNVDCDFFRFRDIDSVFDYYSPTLLVNNDYMNNSPEKVKAFLEATKKGYEYAIDNPEKAADELIKGDNTGSLKQSEELVKESQKFLSKEYKSEVQRWGYIDPERWNGFYKWLKDNNLCSKDLTNVGFTNDYLPE